ncbi:E3 ubiquitin-protein ligase ZNF598 [Diorhabda carinulata]|uniref:E3 ubiquitin-protein ligase ZNF598 n=1 Tax=Diorhabda carinulata TaxID=1163345 RepID=UPI0025A0EFE9|nr:E3 ubiquitin-protein ligase ZNF598 [Diorhabda carinulata]
MSGTEAVNSSETENLCVVCFKTVEIYSIGPCDHAVCFECSTRMRVLCKQNECPICRQLMQKVLFTKTIEAFSVLLPKFERSNLQDRRAGIIFCTSDIQKAYYKLLEHRCSICEDNERKWPFKTFQQLKDHMRREHELFYCDICTENLKIFSFEKRCYNRQELGLHRRKGDPDNTSHRGHPLCEFCDERFMDNEELFRHLRRNHLFCHFCDADGKHQFYNNLDDLVKHFRDEHYLCEEGECKGMPLTSVFRTDIDCKAHKATLHSRFMSKSGAKQARTLELEFTLAPRTRQGNDTRNRRYNERRDRVEEETSSSSYHMEPGGPGGGVEESRGRIFFNPLTPQDFPALGGASSNITVHTRPASVNFTSKLNSNFSSDDFPSLGGSSGSSNTKPSSAVTITTNSSARSSKVPEVTITRVSGGQKRLEKTLENFPALGGPSSSGSGTARVSVSNSEDSNTLSIQVNHRPNSNITTHITASVSSSSQSRPSEAFPALVAITAVQPKWVPAKKKKEPRADKVAPAPQLPPTSLEQFPTLAKKKSSVSVPVSNNWVNLNDINSSNYKNNSNYSNNAKTNGSIDSSRHGSDSSNKKNDIGKPTNSKQKNNVETKLNDLKLNDNGDSKNKSKKKKGKLTETDNSAKNHEPNNNNQPNDSITMNGQVKKRSELKIGKLNSPTEPVITNDFPCLGETKPPPGFSLKPPPGLNPASFPVLGASDFTFTSSSGQSYSIMPVNNYHQPTNFQSRNQDLIKRFMVLLDNDAIKEFKTYSDLFRNGAYPTNKYYEHCREILGDKFDEVFPELLVLLPDLEKQQELYRVYDGKNKKNLVVCENCKQIIFKKELSEHYNNHILENQFPTLGKSQQGNSAWRK